MLSLIKSLGIGWTVWKFAARRFGAVGGFGIAVVLLVAYILLRPWLSEHYPGLTGLVE